MQAFVNPLAFLEVDEPWASVFKKDVAAEDVLRFLCAPGTPSDILSVVERYREISLEGENRIFVTPAIEPILQKLIWPLRHAKGAYALGNYIGTIALCGMVAEMLTIFTFEISAAFLTRSAGAAEMTIENQRLLFGTDFERLGQERRTQVLLAMNWIDSNVKAQYDAVRVLRRRYLHLFSQEHARVAEDAVSSFLATVKLLRSTLGLEVKEGKVMLRPQVLRYLEEHTEPRP